MAKQLIPTMIDQLFSIQELGNEQLKGIVFVRLEYNSKFNIFTIRYNIKHEL